MRTLEIRRHCFTKKGADRGQGSQLSAAGVAQARRLGEHLGPFDRVLTSRVPRTLETALAIERTVQGRTWPDGVDVRLRTGLHSGRPTLTDTGYVGLAVNTVARICSAAHGGQILLSAATRDAVGRSRPTGMRFKGLGSHRLRGLREPQALFQVVAANLRTHFPPLRILAAPAAETGERSS